jgi:hypothetical protein
MDGEIPLQRRLSPLRRADHASGDARRMPIHTHHRPKRLKPEGVRQPLQEFGATVVMGARLADDGAK